MYGYVMNDPINKIDPTGKFSILITQDDLNNAYAGAAAGFGLGLLCGAGPASGVLGAVSVGGASLLTSVLINSELGTAGRPAIINIQIGGKKKKK